MVLMNIGGEGCGEEEEEEEERERDRGGGNMLLCYVLMGTVRAGEKKVSQSWCSADIKLIHTQPPQIQAYIYTYIYKYIIISTGANKIQCV